MRSSRGDRCACKGEGCQSEVYTRNEGGTLPQRVGMRATHMCEGLKDTGVGVYVCGRGTCEINSRGVHQRHASSPSTVPLMSERESEESGVCVRAMGGVDITCGGVARTGAGGCGE